MYAKCLNFYKQSIVQIFFSLPIFSDIRLPSPIRFKQPLGDTIMRGFRNATTSKAMQPLVLKPHVAIL